MNIYLKWELALNTIHVLKTFPVIDQLGTFQYKQ